jgi:3-(methylthio)propanoyl-CoA dehydrogenase
MPSFLKDNEDLQYYVDRGVEWDRLSGLLENGYELPGGFESADDARHFYIDVLQMVGEFAAEEVAPYALEIDRQSPRLVEGEAIFPERLQTIFEKITRFGMHGLLLPRELGGQNAPTLVSFIISELLARAEVSVMAHYGFYSPAAKALLTFAIREGSTRFDPRTGAIVDTRFRKTIEEIGVPSGFSGRVI